VVALESTIISHGMPYPRNKQVVLDTEKLMRSMGVIPAVCAIINGTSSLTDVTDCGHLFLARTEPIRDYVTSFIEVELTSDSYHDHTN
jgi:pseudouridine-5'-phosphate glycosidase